MEKDKIRKAFVDGKIKIKTSSIDGKIEYKNILDALRHITVIKDIYKIVLDNGSNLVATEDHNIFIFVDGKLKPIKPKDNPKKIVFIENDRIKMVDVKKIEKQNVRIYMYDLVVKDNHNFVLNNGILVSNSFSPPSSESTIAGFTRTRGYRWPDESLYSHLVQAANYINLIPPDTSFSLENYPAMWQPLLLQQAMVYALWDLAILWIGEEFNYSLNGISLDIEKSSKYQGIADSLQSALDQNLEKAKTRVHIIKGLAQSRYTYGRGAALGPWCLYKDSKVYDVQKGEQITIEEAYKRQIKMSYSMNSDNELVKNFVTKIWCNGEQELYELVLDNDITIKATHKHLFYDKDNNEIEMGMLKIGQEIWFKKIYNIELAKVLKIEYFGKGMTYDMEMTEPYRNYIANNIVVHNTGGQNIKRWIATGSTVRMGG